MSDDDHPWEGQVRGTALVPYSDDEDDEESSGNYVCTECGYRTSIETPQLRVDHWCNGNCDDWRIFERDTDYDE